MNEMMPFIVTLSVAKEVWSQARLHTAISTFIGLNAKFELHSSLTFSEHWLFIGRELLRKHWSNSNSQTELAHLHIFPTRETH